MPLFMKACKILMKNNPQLKIGIGLAPGVELNKKYNDIAIVETNNTHQLLAASDILFTASGTATLEASILGLPMGVVYKLNFITWILSKNGSSKLNILHYQISYLTNPSCLSLFNQMLTQMQWLIMHKD